MIFIFISIAYHAFILGVIFLCITYILQLSYQLAFDLAFILTVSSTLIAYSKYLHYLIRFFLPNRRAISRELNILMPIIEELLIEINLTYQTDYKTKDFALKIVDSKELNAFAFSDNTIIVTKGALDTFTTEQLKAVLMHEMAHIYYGDSKIKLAFLGSSLGGLIISLFVRLFLLIVRSVKLILPINLNLIALELILLLPALIFLPFIILNFLSNKIFLFLGAYFNRSFEERADLFVLNLNEKDNLIAALEVLEQHSVENNSLLTKLTASHKNIFIRIDFLENTAISAPLLNEYHANSRAIVIKNLLRWGIFIIVTYLLWFSIIYYIFKPNNKNYLNRMSVIYQLQDDINNI